jgi:hypothetical protein
MSIVDLEGELVFLSGYVEAAILVDLIDGKIEAVHLELARRRERSCLGGDDADRHDFLRIGSRRNERHGTYRR